MKTSKRSESDALGEQPLERDRVGIAHVTVAVAPLKLAERAGIAEREDAVDARPLGGELAGAKAVCESFWPSTSSSGSSLNCRTGSQTQMGAPEKRFDAALVRARGAHGGLRETEQNGERREHEREVGGDTTQRHVDGAFSPVSPRGPPRPRGSSG